MAATDFFLKIKGIDGESQDDKHKGWIQIDSYSLGVTNSGSFADSTGGGGGTGRSSFQDMHFTAQIDKAYPKLKLACATGEHIADATLECRKAGGDQEVYLKIKLDDVLVSSCQLGGSSGGGDGIVPVVQFSLNFAKIDVQYGAQDAKGKVSSLDQKMKYDLKAAKKS